MHFLESGEDDDNETKDEHKKKKPVSEPKRKLKVPRKTTFTNIESDSNDENIYQSIFDSVDGDTPKQGNGTKVTFQKPKDDKHTVKEFQRAKVTFKEPEGGKIKPSKSKTGKGPLRRRVKDDNDEGMFLVDQTLGGTFSDVSEVFGEFVFLLAGFFKE